MMNYRELIRLKSLGYSNTSVGASIGSSRNKVAEVWRIAEERHLEWPIPDTLTNKDLDGILYPGRKQANGRQLPDFEYVHKELSKPNVTLTLLWAEYCAQCEAAHAIPYQHTQFNEKYHAYAASKKATLRIKHKPGEVMEVDWGGSTLAVWDGVNTEPLPAYLFVACLPCSLYSYAEAVPDMKMNHWIQAHVHAYQYYQGVTRVLTPDNLKTGVTKNTRSELVLNRTYQEMAEHYGAAIIPTRPVSPQDKANVEGTVGVVSTWIIAALRNQKFFSFQELNDAIKEKLSEFNTRPFQKKKGSRLSAFEEEEKGFLMPLPAFPYETAVWSTAKVQSDYIVPAGNCKYSVPYELIGKEVEIRTTQQCVEVFYQHHRVASHIRVAYSQDPIYNLEHMPVNHRKYCCYNEESFQQWAEEIGSFTLAVVKTFLFTRKVPQQGFRSCSALMKLSDRFTPVRLEAACEKALSYTPQPSLKNISTILQNKQDKVTMPKPPKTDGRYGITRRSVECKGGDLSC
jgi:Transposase and inactivated derivatives